MGGFAKATALGLGLRHDWGSQYRARALQAEIKWLGIRSTPAYVGESRSATASSKRFIRILKEECIYLNDFETLKEAREVIGAFVERYNRGWLLQRHGYLTPAAGRRIGIPSTRTGNLAPGRMCCPINQYAAVITVVDRTGRRPPDGFDDLGSQRRRTSRTGQSRAGGGHNSFMPSPSAPL